MPTCLIVPEAMRKVPERYVDVLRDAGFDILYPKNPQLARNRGGEDELIAELQGVDATIAGSEGYTPRVLAAADKLRVIARAGVGYDGVNVPAATEHGISVTITPTANHEAVAEMTLALLFAASRMIVSNDREVRAGNWPRRLPMATRGKTIGIFGLGRIGSSLAFRAGALGMRVLAT
ncbi:MAG: NAD(P)-dependent oxidoreductase, partial [Pirellulaceae bacterium]